MKALNLFFILCAGCALPLSAEEYDGIEFPEGPRSFADEVVSYEPGHSGGAIPTDPDFIDPSSALGPPDYVRGSSNSVSLGAGGRIVLKFTNNKLTGSDDDTPDLHIFEIGPDVEDTFVGISKDGIAWHEIGKVSGATSSIDIDSLGFSSSDKFEFVRLTDDPEEGEKTGDTVGADIDAVGAIATSPVQHTPRLTVETAILVKFQSLEGSTYVIEESTDLENWSNAVSGIQGDGTVMKFFFEMTTPRKFYRLKPQTAD